MSDNTLRSLAQFYHVSIKQATDALNENGIFPLSEDMPITDRAKLDRYIQIISRIKPAPPHEGKTTVHNQTSSKNSKPDHGQTKNHISDKDAEERQRQLLSRDYVVFTHMALRKPITAQILSQVIELKTKRKTRTQIVVCSETVDYVTEKAKEDDELHQIAESLKVLKKFSMLKILPGMISEENHSISSFIKKCDLSDSILIIGVNRSLSSFIRSWNRTNQNDSRYVTIFERDITSKGFLANPSSQMIAFEDPKGKKLAPYSDAPLTLSCPLPASGDTVYYRNKKNMVPLKLEEEISSGAEAFVYKVMSGTMCAKIFKPTSNSELKMKKVGIMCSKYNVLLNIDTPIMERVAWPEKMLFNEKHEPVGYMMKLFNNTTELADYNSSSFEELIPNVKKENQITMAVTLAELVDFMHHNNIILCDINRKNVLYDNKQSAYLVDLDSAQIADNNYCYKSNVGVPEFLSPEHIYDETFSFVRKKADDVWILQMLIFHILTPDGDPYATSRSYDDEREVVAKGYYPYQAGKNPAESAITGSIWHIIVGHFPPFVKSMFWNSFHGDGKFFHENERKSSTVWLNTIVRYQECLADMVKADPESGKFLPAARKKHIKSTCNVDVTGGSLEDINKRFHSTGKGNKNWKDL